MSPQSHECSADGKVDDLNYPTWLSILLLLVGTVGFLSNILVCVTILKARFLHDVTHYLSSSEGITQGQETSGPSHADRDRYIHHSLHTDTAFVYDHRDY